MGKGFKQTFLQRNLYFGYKYLQNKMCYIHRIVLSPPQKNNKGITDIGDNLGETQNNLKEARL